MGHSCDCKKLKEFSGNPLDPKDNTISKKFWSKKLE